MKDGASLLILTDVCNLLVLLSSFLVSKRKYQQKIGVVSLEKKFQISQVHIWAKSIIPSILVAKLFRFVSLFFITLSLHYDVTKETTAVCYATFDTLLDFFIIVLVLGIIIRHRKLRRSLFFNKVDDCPHTFDGRKIDMNPTHNDYENYLRNQWK
ncbi:unnamed protein product [Caenorhabditis angaria]|uniref:Uncharacterized protein n=1 Tax=Caenorhabditis angaria TaxID=860376 RepID=A0A9P1IWC0_9PELO|nr:unnamed protein product [Caenorhabditis angaria]